MPEAREWLALRLKITIHLRHLNAGLYDQRLVLICVYTITHLPGGDQSRVAAIGENAVPLKQVIPQSPGIVPFPSNYQQDRLFEGVLENANVVAASGHNRRRPLRPQSPRQTPAPRRVRQDLILLIGHNANEGIFFTASLQNESNFEVVIRTSFPNISPAAFPYIMQTIYPPDYSGLHGYTTAPSAPFYSGVRYGVYIYIFSILARTHGEDVPYAFYNGPNADIVNVSAAETLQGHITLFAETGSPDANGEPEFSK
ncbi:hypothetical protein K432DRAFT_430444 [Lepidopterella palustris CBS 459.81]|uniref:Uncharacterized protein n=1 Tax=Lepidopterella palustris CBS 459.81 TaxID=1314670 RepID=A0A8E2J901_9PEZI|nr:hypothetical protein K432DRAFT_430444 [Lepidopterella palustris CBS 459.81]